MPTYDKTQTLGSITLGLLTDTLITKDSGTPNGDKVIVTIASIAGVSGVSSLTVSNGATAIIEGIASLNLLTSLNINTGGTLELGSGIGVSVGSSINFGTAGGTLVLDPGFSLSLLSGLNGWKQGAAIDEEAIGNAGSITTTYNGALANSTTVKLYSGANGTGTVLGTIVLNGGNFTNQVTYATDGHNGTLISFVCFLRGTHVATPAGETRVEELAIGDLVATQEDGATVFRPVTRIGRQSVRVPPEAEMRDSCPVRIRAGAFADGVPHRDLLVTSEHCVFVQGRLVPARMLVNDASIVVETAMRHYECFHVELERHAILLAEGLPAESYLDTGNRPRLVDEAGLAFGAAGARKTWEHDAAAPLAVDRDTVEPIWRFLAERAAFLGLPRPERAAALVADPDLRLLSHTGQEIRPIMVDGAVHVFALPAGARTVRLVSRAARPSETVGPYVDDRRQLGVLVGHMVARDGSAGAMAQTPPSGEGQGWHAPEEGSPHRWTNGDAALTLALTGTANRMVFLDVEVVGGGPYPATAIAVAEAARAA